MAGNNENKKENRAYSQQISIIICTFPKETTENPLEIRTVDRIRLCIMYNLSPVDLTNRAEKGRFSPKVSTLSVAGRPRGYAWCGGSPSG